MKKFFLIIGCVVTCAGLVACGNGVRSQAGSGTVNDPSAATPFANKITIFQDKVEIVDQLGALAADYQAETGIEVEIVGTPGDDFFQQLSDELTKNQGPTIFSTAGGSELSALEDYAIDLGDTQTVSSISNTSLLGYCSEGSPIGIPFTIEGFGMLYNKDIINAPSINSTDAFAKMMTDQKTAGIWGFGLSSESYYLIGHILNTPFAAQPDPDRFIEDLAGGRVTMSEDPIFQEFAKMYDAIRSDSYNPLDYTYAVQLSDFNDGKIAAIHQGSWCYSQFPNPDAINMGLAPLPLFGNTRLAVSAPYYWSVNSQTSVEEQQAGKNFLDWLYTSPKGKDYLYNQMGFIPVITGDTNDNLSPLSQDVQDYMTNGSVIGWPFNQWPAGMIDNYLQPIARDFFTDTSITPEQFLQNLDDAWAKAYGR